MLIWRLNKSPPVFGCPRRRFRRRWGRGSRCVASYATAGAAPASSAIGMAGQNHEKLSKRTSTQSSQFSASKARPGLGKSSRSRIRQDRSCPAGSMSGKFMLGSHPPGPGQNGETP
jgi:hypothetical protein